MRLSRLLPAAAALTVVAVGACSSGTPSGQDAAQRAQDQVVPAGRGLYLRFFHARVASTPAMSGSYLPCPGNDGGTKRYYDVSFSLFPVNRSVSLGAYRRQLADLARADGWKVSPGSPVSVAGVDATRYQLTKGSLTGSLSVLRNVSPKVEGSASVDSACFDAGSAGAGLADQNQDFPLPHVTASAG